MFKVPLHMKRGVVLGPHCVCGAGAGKYLLVYFQQLKEPKVCVCQRECGRGGEERDTNYHDKAPAIVDNYDIDGALLGVACELTQRTSALLTRYTLRTHSFNTG